MWGWEGGAFKEGLREVKGVLVVFISAKKIEKQDSHFEIFASFNLPVKIKHSLTLLYTPC